MLTSNFYPVKFQFEEYQIQRCKYKDGLLVSLREEYNNTRNCLGPDYTVRKDLPCIALINS